jgi:hypothetical protein
MLRYPGWREPRGLVMSERHVYLLWTSPEWCRDGCCDRLRGAFLSKDEVEAAQAQLDQDEPKASHDFHPLRLGRVSGHES